MNVKKQIADQLCEQLDGMFQPSNIIETKSSSALFGEATITVHPTFVQVDQQDVYEAIQCLRIAVDYIMGIETNIPAFREKQNADSVRLQLLVTKLRGVK